MVKSRKLFVGRGGQWRAVIENQFQRAGKGHGSEPPQCWQRCTQRQYMRYNMAGWHFEQILLFNFSFASSNRNLYKGLFISIFFILVISWHDNEKINTEWIKLDFALRKDADRFQFVSNSSRYFYLQCQLIQSS